MTLPRAHKYKTIWYFVSFLRPYWGGIVGTIIALTLAAGTLLALGIGLRQLIDEGFARGQVAFINKGVIVLLGSAFLMAGASYVRYYFISWIEERVVADIKRRIYAHLLTLSPSFFENRRVGELLSRLNTDTTLFQFLIGSSASIGLRSFLQLFGGSVLLFITSPRLAGYVCLMIPLVLAPIFIFGRKLRLLSRQTQEGAADVSADLEETFNAITTVQSSGCEDYHERRFEDVLHLFLSVVKDRIQVRAWLVSIVIALVCASVTIVLWIGGRDVLAGNLSSGQLIAFVFYAVIVVGSINSLSEVAGDFQRAIGASDRLMELLRLRPMIHIPLNPLILPRKCRAYIDFKNVSFSYPSRPETPAIRDSSFSISSGETVAFVGPSGAGKTTLFQLILRFYDPQQGAICFDNISLLDLSPQDLRRHMGLVPQDPVIFSGTVLENIRYGHDATDVEVKRAAKQAFAIDFIETLPHGFLTYLGERGRRLSGGQKQRIAIARAILREPELLLLDEATNSLDSESEHKLQQSLSPIINGRTTLIIAHRLTSVLQADRVVVLDKGQIQAVGTHQMLSRSNALYKRLAKLQFGKIQDDIHKNIL